MKKGRNLFDPFIPFDIAPEERNAPAKRHGLSIDLQMRPPVISEKSDDEL